MASRSCRSGPMSTSPSATNLEDVALERMLAGVSTRRYRRAQEPVGERVEADARSTSKSAASGMFTQRTRDLLWRLMNRPLSDLRLAVIMLDGIDLHGRANIVALGITTEGEKLALGLWDGSSENASCRECHKVCVRQERMEPHAFNTREEDLTRASCSDLSVPARADRRARAPLRSAEASRRLARRWSRRRWVGPAGKIGGGNVRSGARGAIDGLLDQLGAGRDELPDELRERLLDGMIDQLIAGKRGEREILGQEGVLGEITRRMVQRALEEELTEHLGYEPGHAPPGGTGNSRNGGTPRRS